MPHEVREGIVVAAPFPHDQNWYRARVVGVAGSIVELLFVDFGDVAKLDVSMVKILRLQYYTLPMQAIPCRIAKIQPKGQSSDISVSWLLVCCRGYRRLLE